MRPGLLVLIFIVIDGPAGTAPAHYTRLCDAE